MSRFFKAAAPLAVFGLYLAVSLWPSLTPAPLRHLGRALNPYGFTLVLDTGSVLLALALLAWSRGGIKTALKDLGLLSDPVRPLLFGLVATSPSALGLALTGHINPAVSARELLLLCLWFPLCEEVMFRGVAFGQLYRRFAWGFWPAALAPALAFALPHALQGASLAEIAGLPGITGLGAVIFSWFFVRFGWNLWVAVALHAFLNAWWEIFTTNPNALGDWSDNIFRFGSIGLAFALVLLAPRVRALRWLVPAARKPRR
jgi:hypothetical protein